MEAHAIFLLSLPLFLTLHLLLRLVSRRLSRLPPGPTGLPVVGSLFALGDRVHESLANLAAAHGPLMTVQIGSITTVVATTSDAAREILQKNDEAFLGRTIPYSVTAQTDYELAMAWLPGASQQWRRLRRLCTGHLFTTQRLDALLGLRHEMMDRMVRRVAEAGEAGESVSISSVVFGAALGVLSNTMFSVDVVDPKSRTVEEIKEAIHRIMDGAGKRSLADAFPALRGLDPEGLRREVKVAYDKLHALLEETIERRVKRRKMGAARCDDFLDALLDHSVDDDGKHGHGGVDQELLSRQDIKVLLTDLFLGGTDTTTTTVEWAMAELIHNPKAMAKAKQELSESVTVGKRVEERTALNLPYLQSVIKEAMRLHPTSPLLLPHRAEADVQVCGYKIPKHTQVLVNAWAIAQDPGSWDEPTRFIPERFMSSNLDFRGRDCLFLPFGAGRRICPGLTLGVRMLSLVLATLVHNFDWSLPGGMAPEEMDMSDKFGITLQKAEPLIAIGSLVKRQA